MLPATGFVDENGCKESQIDENELELGLINRNQVYLYVYICFFVWVVWVGWRSGSVTHELMVICGRSGFLDGSNMTTPFSGWCSRRGPKQVILNQFCPVIFRSVLIWSGLGH